MTINGSKIKSYQKQITTVIPSIFSSDSDILLEINNVENYKRIHIWKFLKNNVFIMAFTFFSFPPLLFFPEFLMAFGFC